MSPLTNGETIAVSVCTSHSITFSSQYARTMRSETSAFVPSACLCVRTCVSDTCHILLPFDCKDFVVSAIMGSPGDDCRLASDSLRSIPSGEYRANALTLIIQVTFRREMLPMVATRNLTVLAVYTYDRMIYISKNIYYEYIPLSHY